MTTRTIPMKLRARLSARRDREPDSHSAISADLRHYWPRSGHARCMPRRWPRLRIRVRSRIWQQLTAIVLACALPLTIATFLLAVENGRRIEFTRKELRGLEYLAPLSKLLADVSLHRSLHRQVLAGERTLADRQLLDARIDADFTELVRTDAELGRYLATDAAQRS